MVEEDIVEEVLVSLAVSEADYYTALVILAVERLVEHWCEIVEGIVRMGIEVGLVLKHAVLEDQ